MRRDIRPRDKRLLIAGRILAGFGEANPTGGLDANLLASVAYDRADALMQEHHKRCKRYHLRFDGEYYLDQDDVSWSSVESWFFCDILGGCGCGTSEDLATKAIGLLIDLAAPERDYNAFAIKYNDQFWELLMHWFDHAGLVEHGTSIFGSWLTDKGQAIHKILVDNMST